MNLTIAKRSVLVVVLLVFVLLGCGWLVYALSATAREQVESSGENTAGAVALADAQSALWELRYGFPQFMLTEGAARAKIVSDESALRAKIETSFKAYDALHLDPEERKSFDALKAIFAKYMDARPKWFQLMGEGKVDEAKEWRAATTTPFGAATVKGFNEQIVLQKKISETKQKFSVADLDSARVRTLSALALALVLAVIAILWLIRSILAPLNTMRAAIDDLRAGEGDLTRRLPAARGELGDMAHSLNGFVEKLQTILLSIQRSSHGVTNGSGEISAGITNLSSRTEQQASALEETAASMEEMTATVSQNAENARQANKLASSASDIAVRGGQAVREVVGTMTGISDSSKKIGDIIGVIDGIAFQTNILALNAAVEAARAGEQGRGFAVVASEVRSLAQRSAAAAKEIKDLIGDSVAKVDAGSRQVEAAGKTVDEIVTSVKGVTALIAEIAAASQEQAQGIQQVSETVTQLEKVTQQNAAMVEEASAASASLEEQSGELQQAVSTFRLGDDSGTTGSVGAARVTPATSAQSARREAPARRRAADTALPKPRVAAAAHLAKLTKPGAGDGRSGGKPGDKGEGWEEF